MNSRRRSQGVLGLALVFSALWLGSASADTGCLGDEPLVIGHSTQGEWKLPISSEDPDIMTDAQVRVEVLPGPDGHGAYLSLSFSFPDPYPWGLPFTFQRAEFSWENQGKPYSAQVDWSENCTGAGRSMFPHESWTELVELSEGSENLMFEHPVFRLWGSRN